MARVLIIEDDPAVLRLLERILANEGLDFVSVADGEAGEAAWSSGTIDLVLLDAMLPGVDGLTLGRRMRERGDRIPVILVTAREGRPLRELAMRIGIDAYLAKPFGHDDLVTLLRRLLGSRR
jgi:DNA-binding response OmpR family regulator